MDLTACSKSEIIMICINGYLLMAIFSAATALPQNYISPLPTKVQEKLDNLANDVKEYVDHLGITVKSHSRRLAVNRRLDNSYYKYFCSTDCFDSVEKVITDNIATLEACPDSECTTEAPTPEGQTTTPDMTQMFHLFKVVLGCEAAGQMGLDATLCSDAELPAACTGETLPVEGAAAAMGMSQAESTLSEQEQMCMMCNECLMAVMAPLMPADMASDKCYLANKAIMCDGACSKECTDNEGIKKMFGSDDDDNSTSSDDQEEEVQCVDGKNTAKTPSSTQEMTTFIEGVPTYCDACDSCSTTVGSFTLSSAFKTQVSTVLVAFLLILLAK